MAELNSGGWTPENCREILNERYPWPAPNEVVPAGMSWCWCSTPPVFIAPAVDNGASRVGITLTHARSSWS